MYFRSPPKTHPPSSFRDSMAAPAPRKMTIVGGGMTPSKVHTRRCSSIPRPTSKLTGPRTTPPRATGPNGNSSKAPVVGTPQTIVKPRTYSRSRRSSFATTQNDPPSSFKASRVQPPRLSLPVTASQRAECFNDLSGVRQQLPLSQYSRHSLVSLDAMVSSATPKEENKTTNSLRLSSRVIKVNTSSPITKATSPVIPQRQLMAPLGPPVPRSQTMGNLICFAGSSTNTPSPPKSTTGTTRTVGPTSEVDVMAALAESRMTNEEIEYFNQVAREVETNRQRLKGTNRAMRMISNNSSTDVASSKTMPSFSTSDDSFNQAADDFSNMTVGDCSKHLPFRGARLKIIPRSSPSISPPILTPDSGVSMGSPSEKGWEVNAKLVYSHEPVQYWRGRFSTLCDRLRSQDYSLNSAHFASTFTSLKQPYTPKVEVNDSFELEEMRRSAIALEELRSCCRTAEAQISFEAFAHEINAKYERITAARRQTPMYTHSAESKTRLLGTRLYPKVLGIDKNIAAATMKMLGGDTKPKSSMTRSKTTGDMAETQKVVTNAKLAKTGWRRPSHLRAHEEVLASEMALSAERRARAVAAAQRNARRSGIGVGVGAITISEITAQGKMLPPTNKVASRHSLPRKSSGPGAGTGTNADMLKRVFSESVRSVRRMGRSFTGLSGSGDV